MNTSDYPVQLPPVFRGREDEIRTSGVPYHLADLKVPGYWERTGAGRGIRVGVADTGIDHNHPEIVGKVVAAKSFVRGSSTHDGNDHGTHVATTIAGNTVGVAPAVELAIAKVLSDRGAGSNAGVAEGIDWLVDSGCHVINLSLGGAVDDSATREAIHRANKAGVLVFAATGNERAAQVGYPARHCIAVGAVGRDMQLAYFSNRGKDVDLVGFGVDIYAGLPGGRYGEMSGTSMATPFIAGLVANRLSAELKHLGKIITTSSTELLRLETLVTDLGPAGRDTSYGRGFPDLKRGYYEMFDVANPQPPTSDLTFVLEPLELTVKGLSSGREYQPVHMFPKGES